MNRVDPLFAYLSVLSVIQPARIQDVEASAESLLGSKLASWLNDKDLLRQAHLDARNSDFVVAVRRGVYFTTPRGRQIVRRAGLEQSIDNSRFFLMKSQRQRYR